jgi:hypothetical protein
MSTQREDGDDTEEGTAAAPMEVAEEAMEEEAMEEGASQGAAATQTCRLPGLMTQMSRLEQRSKDAPTIVATSRVSGQMELVPVSRPLLLFGFYGLILRASGSAVYILHSLHSYLPPDRGR